MRELNTRVATIAADSEEREVLIRQYKPFILKCASDCAKRYITDADDEWSIALQAFSQALDQYHQEKGSFLSFAKLVIHRRLYDYFASNQKYRHEITVSPALFSGELADDEVVTEVHLQVKERLICQTETTVTDEIAVANGVFAEYGFSFFDLTACSPKAGKTREACVKVAVCLLENSNLLMALRKTRQFPIKILAEKTQVSRKTLERHRKYIIAVVELYSGEYPSLVDYLHPIREELNK